MPLKTFTVFTTLGAGLWVCVLTFMGYLLGEHQELLSKYYNYITIGCIILAVIIILTYWLILKFKNNKKKM